MIGDMAYASAYSEGFRVFDVSDPTEPELYAQYDPFPFSGSTGAFGVYPFSGTAPFYVGDDRAYFCTRSTACYADAAG